MGCGASQRPEVHARADEDISNDPVTIKIESAQVDSLLPAGFVLPDGSASDEKMGSSCCSSAQKENTLDINIGQQPCPLGDEVEELVEMKSPRCAQENLQDPRITMAEFFGPGDDRGPLGSLKHAGVKANTSLETQWFVVFRPTSDDAINNMRSALSTGKGLNIKGKSAKCGKLSGLVPFFQISKPEHRFQLSSASKDARFQVFFQSLESRRQASDSLKQVLDGMRARILKAEASRVELDNGTRNFSNEEEADVYADLNLLMSDPTINLVDTYSPQSFGLDVPEKLLRQAYIMEKDIVPPAGWETGRESEPAFMDMNFIALRDEQGVPKTVLHQFDKENAMNPRGLVMAYAEGDHVMPVVSDFDPFLIGSQGMKFKPVNDEDVKLMKWTLAGVKEVLENNEVAAWTGAWLKILKREATKGFHPTLPQFGFADPTSYQVVSDLVESTGFCGAVRHGTECFNWYFPQELDAEYLIIWDGFGRSGGNPWRYLKEPELRGWLMKRIEEGFAFPLNPTWTCRDPGWYEVLAALRNGTSSQKAAIMSWYPPSSGILEQIDAIHTAHPVASLVPKVGLAKDDSDAMEKADRADLELRRHVTLQRAKRKLRAFLLFQALGRKSKPKEAVAETQAKGNSTIGASCEAYPA